MFTCNNNIVAAICFRLNKIQAELRVLADKLEIINAMSTA